jgi:hypothetical protein
MARKLRDLQEPIAGRVTEKQSPWAGFCATGAWWRSLDARSSTELYLAIARAFRKAQMRSRCLEPGKEGSILTQGQNAASGHFSPARPAVLQRRRARPSHPAHDKMRQW